MIDYYLRFASEAAAKTALAEHLADGGEWPRDKVITDLKVWRDSQDVAGTDAEGNPTVTHDYLPGYFILISLNRVIPALRDAAVVQVVLDRDLARQRRAAGVIKSNVSNAVLQDLRWSPVWCGDDPPWGDMK